MTTQNKLANKIKRLTIGEIWDTISNDGNYVKLYEQDSIVYLESLNEQKDSTMSKKAFIRLLEWYEIEY